MLNVPSALAVVEAATVLSGLYKRMTTGLLAMTCPEIKVEEGRVAVGDGMLPTMVSVSPMEGMLSNTPCPFETRAVHSIGVCPSCRAFARKVNAGPLVDAFCPLLPAIARMKLPFCGPFIADTGSVPNSVVTPILLTSIKLGLYEQINSALV